MYLPKKIPKKMKDKKAIMTFNMIAFIPRIIFLTIALIVCVALIRLMAGSKFDVLGIQAEIISQGFLYGKGGVSYYDPLTGRNYVGIVDVTQLNGTNIDFGFNFPANNLVAARIQVAKDRIEKKKVYMGKILEDFWGYSEDEVKAGMPIATAYYNKEWWDNWWPLAKVRIKGLGGIDVDNTETAILYRDKDGELHSGWLYLTILQPK